LALSPKDSDAFLREVDEELRKEQVGRFVTRYGWWLLAGFIFLLGAVAGWIWWQAREEARAGAEAETLIEALTSMERGNPRAAAPKLNQLSRSDTEGYRAAALFARANAETATGNAPAAIATLRSIVADRSLDQSYRDAALIRQTSLEFDSMTPQAVVQRLRPLARPGSPWLGSAGELVGVAYIRMNRRDLAGPLFGQIARDVTLPDTIRARAAQMASSLGVDVDISAGAAPAPAAQPAPPAQAAPAATKEKAQ